MVWGDILAETGDLEGAMSKYKKANEISPEDEAVKGKLRKIEKLIEAMQNLEKGEKIKKEEAEGKIIGKGWTHQKICNCIIF